MCLLGPFRTLDLSREALFVGNDGDSTAHTEH